MSLADIALAVVSTVAFIGGIAIVAICLVSIFGTLVFMLAGYVIDFRNRKVETNLEQELESLRRQSDALEREWKIFQQSQYDAVFFKMIEEYRNEIH